jgi:hypothetical protein
LYTVVQGRFVVGTITGAHDVADLAIIFEETTYGIPEKESGHWLLPEPLFELIPAGDLGGVIEVAARSDADEGGIARAHTLNRRSRGEFLDIHAWIGNLYSHFIPPDFVSGLRSDRSQLPNLRDLREQ